MMRRAKIVCTLGPSSDSVEVLDAMIRVGMDVARLNFSHGSHEDHARRIARVRKAAKKARRPVAILQDIQGPKIRLGQFKVGELTLVNDQTVTLTPRAILGREGVIPTSLASLAREVKKGDPILLDDGKVRLRVISTHGRDVRCSVVTGGVLKDRKGLNLPNSAVSLPAITTKDERDLRFGQKHGVDYVALSFVRSAADVKRARRILGSSSTPIIAKLEKPQALRSLESIVDAADGVMIARGDLGVELPLEQLPGVQKWALHVAKQRGGLTIVATEMLESMVFNSRPTRAEVSDVANAILDGTDAVMLSAETSIGKYPVHAVETMGRIVAAAERDILRPAPPYEHTDDVPSGIAAAAVAAAREMGIQTIVAYTESGYTAGLIAKFRPGANIYALTPNADVLHRVALYWGVQGFHVPRFGSTDAMVRYVGRLCRDRRICSAGAPVVIVAGVPLNKPGNTNLMTVHRI